MFARTCVCAPPRTQGEGFLEKRPAFEAAVFGRKESLSRTVPGTVTQKSLRLYADAAVSLQAGDGLWLDADAAGEPPYMITSVRHFPRYVLAEAVSRGR